MCLELFSVWFKQMICSCLVTVSVVKVNIVLSDGSKSLNSVLFHKRSKFMMYITSLT